MKQSDLALLGIDIRALDDLGEEEDAIQLDHTIGLNKLLKGLEDRGKEEQARFKMVALVIEMALRNLYGCPLTVCYQMLENKDVVTIKMTNPGLQMISDISVILGDPYVIQLSQKISNREYSNCLRNGPKNLIPMVNAALEWACVPPNPSAPLFFNKNYKRCVFIDTDGSVKIFFNDGKIAKYTDGLIPSWAKTIVTQWSEQKLTGIYTVFRGEETLFTKLNPVAMKAHGIFVLEEPQKAPKIAVKGPYAAG